MIQFLVVKTLKLNITFSASESVSVSLHAVRIVATTCLLMIF